MALVSHIHKFIYIKNKKVAGSSTESFFGKYCTDPTSSYHYNDEIDELITKFGIVGSRLGGKRKNWVSHKPAALIKKDIGKDIFEEYYKFCCVRNPWDKMVSLYKNDRIQKNPTSNNPHRSFENFLDSYNGHADDWSIHTINNNFICDYYIKFENLYEGIIEVCKNIGIKEYDISLLPHHKGRKNKSTKPYQEFYNEKTKNILYNKNKLYIDYFNYKF